MHTFEHGIVTTPRINGCGDTFVFIVLYGHHRSIGGTLSASTTAPGSAGVSLVASIKHIAFFLASSRLSAGSAKTAACALLMAWFRLSTQCCSPCCRAASSSKVKSLVNVSFST